MLLNVGKKLKEACADRAEPARFTCLGYRQSIRLARIKGLQLLSSFLYYFSLSYLDRHSMGTEVGRFERFVSLFLALFCQAFFSVFSGQYFFGTYRFLLEKLKVMFPFSTDTVTLCLNVSWAGAICKSSTFKNGFLKIRFHSF